MLKHLDGFDEKLERNNQIRHQVLNLWGDETQKVGDFEVNKLEKIVSLPSEEMAMGYIKEVKQRYAEQLRTKEAREQRRRVVLLNASRIHHIHQEEKRNEIIAEQLERRSQLEKRLSTQLQQLHHEKETIIANRILRETQLRQQREENFKEALKQQKLEREEEAREIAEKIKNEREQRRVEKYTRHLHQIRVEIVLPIVDFATKIAEYREMTGRLIPISLFRQWRKLLLTGKPLFPESHRADREMGKTNETPAQRENSADVLEDRETLLDEQDLQDYTVLQLRLVIIIIILIVKRSLAFQRATPVLCQHRLVRFHRAADWEAQLCPSKRILRTVRVFLSAHFGFFAGVC
ncbi:unnamed protein product [Schistocephalus solidus]|uniref:Coiled-coil domain containing 113 n=1 Tax=Schistocephalus solidus TaxID=70667 RepID=A0A183TEE2_SCHSO|nr:unnamed protein product [Schistocephalus solidus]